jgi:hypothetical protein
MSDAVDRMDLSSMGNKFSIDEMLFRKVFGRVRYGIINYRIVLCKMLFAICEPMETN